MRSALRIKRVAFPVVLLSAVTALVFGYSRDSETDRAAAYPNRPIRLVVPFGAGGGTDTFARIIKKAIEDNRLLPQPLVIINIDGAGATIGSRRVKDAKPDGYTAMILHDAIVTAKYSGKANYGPEAFEPIAGTGQVGMVITVAESSEFKSLPDLMQAAQQNPDELGFGANMGALTHFAGLQLEKAHAGARFQFAQIGGGAKRFSDLIGGHIDVTGFSIEEFVRFRPSGLRGLAYFGGERHAAAPDVPTAREQGYDITSSNTFYWWFPLQTSHNRIDTFAAALEKAMQTDYVQRKMDEIQCEPVFLKGELLSAHIAATQAAISTISLRPSTSLPNLPAIIAGAVVLLVVWLVVSRGRPQGFSAGAARQSDKTRMAPAEPAEHVPSAGLAVSCLVLVAVYVVALGLPGIDFRPATVAFVMAVGLTLTRFDARHVLPLVAVALVLGFGIFRLFTKVFVVDLP